MQAFLLLYGGSLVTMIAAVFGILTADKKSRAITGLALAGVLGGTAFACWSAYEQDKQHTAEVQQQDSKIQKTDDDVNQLRQELEGQGVLKSTAESASTSQVKALLREAKVANDYIARTTPARRPELTIWLFPHVQQDVNFDALKARLDKIAGTVVEHSPVLRQAEVKTNSVWWSAGTADGFEAAKAVALVVASAGVGIQQVCQSQSVPMKNLIQIGGSAKAASGHVYTADEIAKLAAPVCY